MNIENYIATCRELVNHELNKKLPRETQALYKLHIAMRYAVLNGVKRMRSSFVYAIGEVLSTEMTNNTNSESYE